MSATLAAVAARRKAARTAEAGVRNARPRRRAPRHAVCIQLDQPRRCRRDGDETAAGCPAAMGAAMSADDLGAIYLAALQKRRDEYGAAQSTIDALLYSLRLGVEVLTRDDVQHRLAVVHEYQLREMIALLQKRNGKIAPPWQDSEIEKLIQAWTLCHG